MNTFQHDWDLLKATQETLREHMQLIRELKAENKTFRAAQKACDLCDAPTIARINELEAELDAVRGLVEKWRTDPDHYDWLCVDELQAALRGEYE